MLLVDVIEPRLPLRPLSTCVCALIALNTVAHYFWAITISPGFADEDIRMSGARSRSQSSFLVKLLTAPERQPSSNHEILHGYELETGRIGKCNKCGSIKPEVCPSCIKIESLNQSSLSTADTSLSNMQTLCIEI